MAPREGTCAVLPLRYNIAKITWENPTNDLDYADIEWGTTSLQNVIRQMPERYYQKGLDDTKTYLYTLAMCNQKGCSKCRITDYNNGTYTGQVGSEETKELIPVKIIGKTTVAVPFTDSETENPMLMQLGRSYNENGKLAVELNYITGCKDVCIFCAKITGQEAQCETTKKGDGWKTMKIYPSMKGGRKSTYYFTASLNTLNDEGKAVNVSSMVATFKTIFLGDYFNSVTNTYEKISKGKFKDGEGCPVTWFYVQNMNNGFGLGWENWDFDGSAVEKQYVLCQRFNEQSNPTFELMHGNHFRETVVSASAAIAGYSTIGDLIGRDYWQNITGVLGLPDSFFVLPESSTVPEGTLEGDVIAIPVSEPAVTQPVSVPTVVSSTYCDPYNSKIICGVNWSGYTGGYKTAK